MSEPPRRRDAASAAHAADLSRARSSPVTYDSSPVAIRDAASDHRIPNEETNVSHELFDRHRATVDRAIEAIRTRAYWSAYPETPSGQIYGETAKEEGERAFKGRLNQPFALDQPGISGGVGNEQSPYGFALGVTYPRPNLDACLAAAQRAMTDWSKADVESRIGIGLEILHRLNRRSFELAFAVMHTTGQGFMMAFQAGGPHAQDRGLEAIAYAFEEMSRVPQQATWSKQVSKTETVTLQKTYRIVPRGVALVIGCSTFPTWNSYPGIFASLVTGNAVIVKPHPGAILPLAITVEVARVVLREQGFDPNVIMLAADTVESPITKDLVARPEVRIIDYTGGSAFGEWIEQHARHAAVFTEKAGVNSIIIDSADDLRAMTGNIAFTLSLYSGQMCTTSQNIYISRKGIDVGGEHKSFDEIAQAIVKAVDWLLGEPARATEILGCIQNDQTLRRVDQAISDGGAVLRPPAKVANDRFADARACSPLMLKVDAKDQKLYMREMFGPISYIIATDSTQQSIDLARQSAQQLGAITWSIYSTSAQVIEKAEDAAAEAGVPVSCNLTGQIYVNQAAAFSDYHVTGCNPSGNATLCDAAFVAPRFRVVQTRVSAPVPAAVPVGS
jgi:phenylacetic acid degradation protein paaN